jgi:hypothetical protein
MPDRDFVIIMEGGLEPTVYGPITGKNRQEIEEKTKRTLLKALRIHGDLCAVPGDDNCFGITVRISKSGSVRLLTRTWSGGYMNQLRRKVNPHFKPDHEPVSLRILEAEEAAIRMIEQPEHRV